jgi:hypothetical protein
MIKNLTYRELALVLRSVFDPGESERDFTILVDLPTPAMPDALAWLDRRRMSVEWFSMLEEHVTDWPFQAFNFAVYDNVGSNNADLPPVVDIADSRPGRGPSLPAGKIPLGELLARSSVVLSPTQLSATAPLKVLARTHGFRGATLPNFKRSMIPALRLDYEAVDARVQQVKRRMDEAEGANLVLATGRKNYTIFLDLRHRSGSASGGLIRQAGVVANLPSGEAYIVPYEGEKEGDPSRTEGDLPVQFRDEIVLFRVRENRAREILTPGPESEKQRWKLREESAYGNLAELGIGVLGEWGISAVGSTLLDEKLGLHIAFGRSDHFGGATDPQAFKHPARVVHVDWVYVPSVQPKISVDTLTFRYADGSTELIMNANQIVI